MKRMAPCTTIEISGAANIGRFQKEHRPIARDGGSF
jgi:hypothetical protein